jgi:hypothetical protein
MRYRIASRIAIWACAGFLVAGCWALYVFATSPYANEQMRDVWLLAALTCPITLVRTHPISLYEVLIANAVTYALVGLIVETLRQRLSKGKVIRV